MDFTKQHLEFWRTLFAPADAVCVAKYIQGTSLRLVPQSEDTSYPWAQFVGLNAFHAGRSRADANVAQHRSFLLEFDDLEQGEQLELMRQAGVPWSTCVFSGNRSLHFIIALTEPVSASTYQSIASRLLLALPPADAACRNPSRFTRYPGVRRLDTGKVQELLEVRGRVPLAELLAWLEEHEPRQDKVRPKLLELPSQRQRPEPPELPAGTFPLALLPPTIALESSRQRLRNRTLGFLVSGAERNRNQETFAAACDFAECGYEETSTLAYLLPLLPLLSQQKAAPFTEQELRAAVASAYRRFATRQTATAS